MVSVFSSPADIRYVEHQLSSGQHLGSSNCWDRQNLVRNTEFSRPGGVRIRQPRAFNSCRDFLVCDRLSLFCRALLHSAAQDHLLHGHRSC